MDRPEPHAPDRRRQAEALIRQGVAVAEIAGRLGVPFGTVYRWKRGLAAPKGRRRAIHPLCPGAWTIRRREAVGRLLAEPGIDAGDLAQALGGTRKEASALRRACGLPGRRLTVRTAAPGLGDLNAALRNHIGRQIAALDARLKADDANLDSSKALRDLGGLTRLLDQLAQAEPDRGAELARTNRRARDDHGDADEGAQENLPALRERLARRIAAFAGDWPPDRIPGESVATRTAATEP